MRSWKISLTVPSAISRPRPHVAIAHASESSQSRMTLADCHSRVFAEYHPDRTTLMFSRITLQLFADRTLLAERLSTSTLEPIAQQLVSLISVIMPTTHQIRWNGSANNKASYDASSRTAAILVLMSDNRGCGPGPSGNGCCAAGGIMRYLNTIRKVTPTR